MSAGYHNKSGDDLQLLADGCTVLLRSVFGENNWYRWNEIKQHTQLPNLQAFITWMLDIAEQEINKDTDTRELYSEVETEEVEEAIGNVEDYESHHYSPAKAEIKVEYTDGYGSPTLTFSNNSHLQRSSVKDPVEDASAIDNNCVEIFYGLYDKKSFYCDTCKVSLSDTEVVKEHLQLRHSHQPQLDINCCCCSQKFTTVVDYIEYHKASGLQSTSANSKYRHVCSYCAKGFNVKRLLNEHVANKHLKTGPSYECPHCFKKFSHSNNLYTHKKRCGVNLNI